MGGLGFIHHFTRNTAAAHAVLALIDWVEVGVRHPSTVKVDELGIERIFDKAGVIQQTVIGTVGHNRIDRPLRIRRGFDLGFNGFALEFALRDPTENTVGVTGRAEINRRDVAHHHEVGQRFMAVTVNQHGAT